MKKITAIILIICMITGITGLFAGCGDDSCAHTYGDWKIVSEATCTQNGTKERICSKCNDKETATIPAVGHNFVNGICTDCGAKE